MQDLFLRKVVDELIEGKQPKFSFYDNILRFINYLCVSNIEAIKEKILEEAHSTWYSIQSGGTKTYRDLKEVY